MSPEEDAEIQIIDVWAHNLEEEFVRIRDVVVDYPYIAMDTEFPGMVCRPVGNYSFSEFNYATLMTNVNMLKLIQVGLTFSDANGKIPDCGTGNGGIVWQFNFREFDHKNDLCGRDSIDLLNNSGIDFERNCKDGIEATRFAELLMSCGGVLKDDVYWVTFHSSYDFGYLIKLLTGRDLPATQEEFFGLVKVFFPVLYDIKHLMVYCNSLHGGLNKLGELLGVKRIGISHQAGSDSLLTLRTYFKLREEFFGGSTEKFAGVLYGLDVDLGQNSVE